MHYCDIAFVLGESFSVVAKIKPGVKAELKVTRIDNGSAFVGKNTTEFPELPILHVNRAINGDAGMFSWSLLSDVGNFTGTFEIIVLEKGKYVQQVKGRQHEKMYLLPLSC